MKYKLKLSFGINYICKLSFVHKNKNSSSSAFNVDEDIVIQLEIPRCAAITKVKFNIRKDGADEVICESVGAWLGLNSCFDIFEFKLESGRLPRGLYFAEIHCSNYLTEWTSSFEDGNIILNNGGDHKKYIQITVTDSKFLLPKSNFGGIIYHIFVDRFRRTRDFIPPEGGIHLKGEWDTIPEIPEYPGAPIKNNTFYGGTLGGIEEKLDYLSALGVDKIYLSPIMASPSNHRYDISDYMTVEPSVGGEGALVSLIREAKTCGIGIIIDGVFNHTGSDSIYFNKYSRFDSLGAYQSKQSTYFDWYTFYDFPCKYECWWGIDILPRIDPEVKSCKEYFLGADGVISKYSRLGIVGMRLDVVDELPSEFVEGIKKVLHDNGAPLLYGEVWEDASNKIAYGKRRSYYLGAELDGVMNYPLRDGIIEYIRDKKVDKLSYALREVYINAPKQVADMQMNLLGSHDTERILTALGDNKGDSYSSFIDHIAEMRLIAAYTLITALPGTPCIYYGDEVGMEGRSDPFNRMPYPWGRENNRLLTHYRRAGAVRRSSDAFAIGRFDIIELSSGLLVFKRQLDDEIYVAIFNNSSDDIKVYFSREVTSCLDDEVILNKRLSPLKAEIFKTQKNNKVKIIKE